jgi:hypothetical protein
MEMVTIIKVVLERCENWVTLAAEAKVLDALTRLSGNLRKLP